jgi:phytoene desaturase
MKVAVIGAGIAGLATSVRLALQGHEVHVFESADIAGGKLTQFSESGHSGEYRFDAGPSLFTMPMYVDELFVLAGKKPSDYFQYQRLSTVCHYFWEDGTHLKAYSDIEKFAEETSLVLDVPKSLIIKHLHSAEKKYELTGKIFLEKSLHRISTWLSLDVLKALTKIHTFGLFKSMNQIHTKKMKHPKLVQLFNRFATYNGSNPFKASGMLTMIPHFEHGIGAYFPKGGMYSITKSIQSLGESLGVNYHFHSPVLEILIEKNKATGLKLSQENFFADIVVSNMDIVPTYRKLLPNLTAPEKTLNQKRSTSALIFYWGIKHQFSELDMHNIFFSNDYENEFSELEKGNISDDPTIYLNITSRHEIGDAPVGCDNWFVMVNVPHDQNQDWEELISKTRSNILKKLSRMFNSSIETLIETESFLDPKSIEARTGSFRGALYGASSDDRMAAFLRHPNFSNSISNLFFCGGSVHPGGGIPLCLLSAKLVDESIKEYCG